MKVETETLRKDVVSRCPEPFDCAVSEELRTILAQSMRRLHPKQALIIERSLCDSESYRVIGKELGCSHESVRKLKVKGLNNLREMLGFLGEEFDSPNIPNISERVHPKNVPVGTKRICIRDLTPAQKHERRQRLQHEWYLKNKTEIRDRRRRLYLENKEWAYELSRRWQQKNPARWKQYQEQYHKQRSENLGDAYVAEQLIAGTCLTKQDIPHKLIKIRRLELQLTRAIKRKGEAGET